MISHIIIKKYAIWLILECAWAKMARKSWDLLHRSCWAALEIHTLRTSPRMEVPLSELGSSYLPPLVYVDIEWPLTLINHLESQSINKKSKQSSDFKFKGLLIKSLKCKNSEFDDNPEITAYIQVKDMMNKDNNEVFIFNGWTFSSSPAVNPFDHPVYDVWLKRCY